MATIARESAMATFARESPKATIARESAMTTIARESAMATIEPLPNQIEWRYRVLTLDRGTSGWQYFGRYYRGRVNVKWGQRGEDTLGLWNAFSWRGLR